MDRPPAEKPDAADLTMEQVRAISRLARLELSEERCEEYRSELAEVLAWGRKLDVPETEELEPMTVLTESEAEHLTIRVDDDAPGPMLDQDTLHSMAPAMDGLFVRVPKVLSGGGS